jgi:hypothetical protein
MSIYRKYAQGPVKNSDFVLDSNNISEYLAYARNMYDELHHIETLCDLEYKLANQDKVDDELYTPEYLQGRLARLGQSREMTSELSVIKSMKERLYQVNMQIDTLRPIVFDQVRGKDPLVHERMSTLDDERKTLEEDICTAFGARYTALQRDLPKVFYIILDGVDFNNVEQCFAMMRRVLVNGTTYENATAGLAQNASRKYNLPQGFWDPIFNGSAGRAYRTGPAPKSGKK